MTFDNWQVRSFAVRRSSFIPDAFTGTPDVLIGIPHVLSGMQRLYNGPMSRKGNLGGNIIHLPMPALQYLNSAEPVMYASEPGFPAWASSIFHT